MKRAAVGTVALLALAWPATGWAEAEPDYSRSGFYLGLAGHYAIDNYEDELQDEVDSVVSGVDVSVDGSGGLGVRAGYRVWKRFATELQWEWQEGFDIAANDVDLITLEAWALTANSRIYLGTERLQPNVIVGLGVYHAELDGGGIEDDGETDLVVRLGGGIDLYATEQIALSFEATYLLPKGDVDDLDTASFGLGVQFRF
ncbi:MAG: porin family protein [Proteobacteria bacterium]|nr:porin family protein [Pseudomonadota bacterium]